MRLGASSLAPRPQHTQPVVVLAGVFLLALPPRRVQRNAARLVLKPVAVQRTAVAADDAPEPEGFPPESLGNFQSSQPRKVVPKTAPAPVRQVILGLLQLAAVVGVLILWPGAGHSDHIPIRVWQAAALYCTFFGFAGLRRTLKYGKLSSRKNHAQVFSHASKRAIISYVVVVALGTAPTHSHAHVHPMAKCVAEHLHFTCLHICKLSQALQAFDFTTARQWHGTHKA